jgi:hypothetical protein
MIIVPIDVVCDECDRKLQLKVNMKWDVTHAGYVVARTSPLELNKLAAIACGYPAHTAVGKGRWVITMDKVTCPEH